MTLADRLFQTRPLRRVAAALLCLCAHFAAHAAPLPPPHARQTENRPALTPQIGHSALVSSAAFSPDGRQIVTASYDSTARVWDAATGTLIRTLVGHSNLVSSAAFSPDGRKIITASADCTAKVWDATTGTLIRTLTGHSRSVYSAAFSPDGKQIVTASMDGTAKVWDAANGALIYTLTGHRDQVKSAAFSPDGKQIVTASDDKTAKVWNTINGALIRTLAGHSSMVDFAAFSPDGKKIVTASRDGTAKVWNTATGTLIHTLTGHSSDVHSAAFSPDGKQIVSSGGDRTARVWDSATGTLIHTLAGHSNNVTSAAFSSDGKKIVTAEDYTAKVWDAATGTVIRTLTGDSSGVLSAAFSPYSKQIVTASQDGTAKLWDAASGTLIRTLTQYSGNVLSAAFSPDGKQIVAASNDWTAKVWNAASGTLIRTLTGHEADVSSAAFSPDSKRIVTGSWDHTAKIWNAANGTLIRTLTGHSDFVLSTTFSPDGKQIVTASQDGTAKLWDAANGTLICTLTGHSSGVNCAAFSSDGKQIVTASGDGTAKVWNAANGTLIRTLTGHSRSVYSAAFSPDGKQIVTAGDDRTARVWDAATGALIRTLTGHSNGILSVAYSPNGKQIVTSSEDQTVKIWNAATGKEFCTLIAFDDGTWAVTDPEGRYDGNNGGDVAGLHWVVGSEAIDLAQLRDRYYEPGLLAKVMGFDKSPLRDVQAFDHVKLYPEVTTAPDPSGANKIAVHLTERGGGIGRVQVYVNGVLYKDDARPVGTDPTAHTLDFAVDLSAAPTLRPGGLTANAVRVVVYNGENWLPSRGLDLADAAGPSPATALPTPVPAKRRLFAVVAGTSDYALRMLHLAFPARDAAAFAAALRRGATDDPLIDRPDITLLASGDGAPNGTLPPTKANIEAAFAHIIAEHPSPDDILVVYLSGHGVAIPLNDSTYCYLTQNANSADLATFANDSALRAATTVTSGELADWMGKIGATYRVVILDTCAAGAAGREFMAKRAVPGDQIRAMKRFEATEGCHVLMGCASDKVSYEASQYGQGLLTYALLQGMKGPALRENSWIDVRSLFAYAEETVPKLAGDIGGIQQPTYQKPDAGSFDIGRLTETDRAGIHLDTSRPQIVHPVMTNKADGIDDLELGTLLRARLSDTDAYASPDGLSADGPDSAANGTAGAPNGNSTSFVYVDADALTGAIQPIGQYVESGDNVTVTITLLRDHQRVGSAAVTGSKATDASREALAAKIETAVEKALRR